VPVVAESDQIHVSVLHPDAGDGRVAEREVNGASGRQAEQAALQFVERAPWIPSYNIEYFVGLDGISVSMILLTVLLCPICVLASWGIERALKGYFALFLLLDASILGGLGRYAGG